jgi:hypothetical protein
MSAFSGLLHYMALAAGLFTVAGLAGLIYDAFKHRKGKR